MGEYLGFFLFLGIILMAFWLLIFLITFLGYWATANVLESLMPGVFFKNKDQEPESTEQH